MATKRLKDWFFQITNVPRADGTIGGVRFRKSDKSTQGTFEDLLASTTFSKESSDRAKIYTASVDLGTEQGLVVLATDAQAKANQIQLLDRSLVVQPSQLPTAEAVANTVTEDMPVTPLQVQIGAATTRNQYTFRLAASWITWLISRIFKQGGVEGDVPIKNSGTNYDWSYGNVGNNTTTVNTIANNSNFVTTLTNNPAFATAIQNTVNNILVTNPQYFTDSLPVGVIIADTAIGALGSKWLLANGTAISRTTYAALFSKIGTTYGVGDGSTTFNLPNLSQKQISGYDNTLGYTLGAIGGSHTQTLIEANLPPHTHGAGTLGATYNGDHTHFVTRYQAASGSGSFLESGDDSDTEGDTETTLNGGHTHSISGNTGNGNGASTEFSIKDQYLSLPFYIKAII